MNIARIVYLVKKDLNVFKRYYIGISLLMLAVSMLIIVANTNMIRIFSASGSSIAIVAIYTFMIERKTLSAWSHIASLPIDRKEMNTARFLSVLLISTTNLILWVLCYHSILYFVIDRPEHTASISVVVFAFMNMLIYLALYFICYYRVNNIAIMLVYIIPVLLLNFMNPGETSFSEYIINDDRRFWIFCSCSLGVFIGSYVYSNHYFKSKAL